MKVENYFLQMLCLLALGVPWATQAQNARVSEYDGSVTTATYSSIAGTPGASAWTAANQAAGYVDVQMPFAMYFGETQITSGSTLRVYDDGSVAFADQLTDSRIAPLYYSAGYTTTGSSIYTKSSASMLTVEWRKVVSGTSSYSFQLKIYPSGDIEFCYGPMTLSGSINVLVGMMSSATDIYRVGGPNGSSAWDDISRHTTGTTTRTLSPAYAPAYNAATGVGMVYSFTQPACVKPTTIAATAVSWDSIKVDWTLSSTGSNYELKYSTVADFDPNTEGTVKAVNSSAATSTYLTGLTGGTTYYIYMRKICSGTPSGWTAVVSATTPPSCFSANMPSVTANGVVTWTSPSALVTSYDVKYGASGFDPETAGTAISGLTALTTTIPNLASNQRYDVYLRTHCSASGLTTDWVGPVSFISPCINGCTYTLLLTDSYGDTWNGNHLDYYSNGILMASYTNEVNDTDTIEVSVCNGDSIRFVYVADGQFASENSTTIINHMGEVLVDEYGGGNGTAVIYSGAACYVPTCPKPSNLAVSNVNGNNVTLSWTENGTATAWQVAYGFYATEDDYVVVNATTNPFTVSNLGLGETFFYIRSNCAADDQSDWVGPVSHNLGYCNPAPASHDGSGISKVTFGNDLVVNDNTATTVQTRYQNHSDMIGDLFVGTLSEVNITYRTGYTYGTKIWIDFNNDLDFEDAGELVYTGLSSNANPTTLVAIFTIPAGTALGDYRMRVGGTDNDAGPTPCFTGSYGVMRDYTVRVVDAPSCFQPNSLVATGVTATAATLNWVEAGLSTQWEVKYGPRGFNPDEAGVSVVVDNTPTLTLDYLYMVTDYDAYVRALCNPEGPTAWSNVCEFSTSCPNGGDLVIGEGTATNTNIPSYSFYNYSLTEQIFTAAELGGANTFTSLSLKYSGYKARTVDVYLVETDKETFTSGTDWVAVTAADKVYSGPLCPSGATGWNTMVFTTPFNYSGNHNLVVVIDDNTGGYQNGLSAYVSNAPSKAISIYSDGTDYNPFSPGSYSGTVLSVRNNIMLGVPCDTGSCNAPHMAIALSETEYAATLTFTNVNDDIANPTYGIVYGPQGFDPATAGTTVSPINANSHTISGLSAETAYDVYVYAICAGTDGRMVRYNFTTPFIPNCKVPILSEAGYGASDITYNTAAISWRQPGDAPLRWTVRYAAANFDPATAAESEYTEQTVAASSASLTGLVAGTTYYVYVKATCALSPLDESAWSAVYSFATPTCVVPSNVLVSNVTNSTAEVAWTESGLATAWTLKYGLAGFDPETEGAEVACATTAVELTGLVPYTTYEVYVRSNCTATDISSWSNAASFRTVCPDGGDVEILGNTASTNNSTPVNNFYNYSYTQQIITAAEIPGATEIGGISFKYAYSVPNSDKTNTNIYIGVTDKNSFASTSDFVDPASLTLVYSGPLVCQQGWNNFMFDTPFAYDGLSNIVIAVDDNSHAYDGNSYTFNTMSTSSPMVLAYYSDSQNPDPATSATLAAFSGSKVTNNYRNVMKLMTTCNDVNCFVPASVAASVNTDNTVAVSWTSRGDLRPVVNNFEMKYGLAGFDPQTEGTLVADLDSIFNYQITAPLDYDANYDVYVRTVCDAANGDYSKWAKTTFHTYPSCWAPTALAVTATTSSSATLSWEENTPSPASRWEVVYGFAGFNPSQATPVETTNNSAFEVDGLRHSAQYEFYVRAKCGDSDVSAWSAVATGTTQCGVWQYEDMPMVENFDGVAGNTSGTVANHRMPNCWSYLNTGTNTSYMGLPSLYNSTTYAQSTPNSLRFYVGTATSYGEQIAILPEFGFDLDTLEINFYARFGNNSSSIQVGAMTDPNDISTFVPVATVQAPASGYSTQSYYEVSFSEYEGPARYVAFKAERGTTTNSLYMDDLTVKLRERLNLLPDAGQTMTMCSEFVMPDTTNGGSYHGNLNATYVIRPDEAGKVVRLTGKYDLENGYDYLNVYRGAAVASNLVGRYTGAGMIDYSTQSNNWVDSGYVTLVLTTDADNAFGYEGFKLLVECICPTPAVNTIVETAEANGSYTWRNGTTYTNNIVRRGLTYDAAGSRTENDLMVNELHTYYNVAGCDSVYYALELTLHPSYHLTYNADVCERDTFTFCGNDYTVGGEYTVALTSQYGADSTLVLNLQRHAAPSVGIYRNNREVTAIADYCDNADLALLARSDNNAAAFLWEDSSTAANRVVNPHESDTYTVVATETVYGCSSLPASVTVTTVPSPALSIAGDAEICYGQSATLTLADSNNMDASYRWSTGATATSITVNPTQTTIYTATATTNNASACTSTASFTVTVNALPVVDALVSVSEICRDSIVTLSATEVEGYSYSWNTGATSAITTVPVAATGSFTVTVTDQKGCVNEIATAPITVHPSYEVNNSQSVCYTQNPYTWGEMTITANGNYDQNFIIAHGCDSLVHLDFTFEEMGVVNNSIERCYGATYTFDNNSYTATADTALYYIDNSGECPVRYNLAVAVNPVKTVVDEQTACDSYTWAANGATYTTSGAYMATLATTKGCDSVVTMNLTVNYQNTGVETVTACDSYVWNLDGMSYNATTDTPAFTLQNQYGCDSVVTLNLTVNYRSYHEDFHCVSDSRTYTWADGETYSLNVAVSDSIGHVTGTNEYGCNEIALLHLVMNPVIDTLNWATVTACDEYEINTVNIDANCGSEVVATYLRESGDYQLRTRNEATGNDQWTRLHLTISNSTYHTTVAEACLPYEWILNVGTDAEPVYYSVATITEEMVAGAAVYNMSYEMPAQYTNGCSRIEVLRLTPKYATSDTIEAAICQNGSWTAENGVTYYGANLPVGNTVLTWDNSQLNAAGCPLTQKVNLKVNPVYHDYAQVVICENELVFNEESNLYEYVIYDTVANHNNDSIIASLDGLPNGSPTSLSRDINWWYTADGCDSTINLSFTVNPTLHVEETYTVCYSDRFEWNVNGRSYTDAGVYNDTVLNVNPTTGCQLYNELNLTVLGTATGTDTINVCTFYTGPDGVTYRDSRTFTVRYEGNLPIVGGCDSVTLVTYNVMQNTLTEDYILTNAAYTWRNGTVYTANADNVYYTAGAAAGGCEEVYMLHLTMVEPIAVCENSLPYTVSYGNSSFVIPADALDNGVTGNGADTILHYTVLRNTAMTVAETACDSYTWSTGNDSTYTASGIYEWTTTNAAGCDSVVTLNLTVNASSTATVADTACDSYTWSTGDDSTYTATGVYTWTTVNAVGCDSVVTLNLTINRNAGVEIAATACQTYTWERNGQTYTNNGDEPLVADHTYAFNDANGCTGDSTLHLTLNPVHATSSTVVVNDDASYLYNGVMYTAPCDSTFSTTFTNQYGCDSVHTLHLIIPVIDQITEVTVEACGSYTWSIAGVDHTYEWISAAERMSHGMALYKDATFNQYVYTFPTDTLFDASGAMTAVRVLHLNLLEATTSAETVNVPVSLASYSIYGVAGAVEGVALATFNFTYADRGITFDTAVEVGSLAYCNDLRSYTINLIDNYDTTEVYVCASESSYEWNGTAYTIGTPGHTFYFYQVENAGTLNEQVHVLKLNQRALNATTTTVTACESYTWAAGDGQTYTAGGTMVYDYTDSNQCAATKTLNLTVNYNSNTAHTAVACDSYTWTAATGGNGQTYTATGDYEYNYTNAAGCASTDTLHLTINANSNQAYTAAACNSYTWTEGDGQTYTTSGTYTHQYNSAENGCPSVDTLYLTINLPADQTITMTVCDSMKWHGTTYDLSGTYTYDYTSEAGCASTDRLELTVNRATHNVETTNQCDSYEWNGQTYTASGIYTYAYTNVIPGAAEGCPSVDTLHLTINVNTSTVNDTVTACNEYSWAVNNRLYNTSGNYTARTTDTNGCATVNTLTLTVNHTNSYDSVLYVSDGSYRYYGQNATELFGEGVYHRSELYTNVDGCDSTLNITFNVGTALLGVDNVVNCNEFTWRNGETYVWISAAERAANLNGENVQPLYKTATGTYIYYNPTFTVARDNAFDSIYMLALTLTQSYNGNDEITMNVSDAMLTYGDSTFYFTSEAALQQNFVNETREYDVHFGAVQYCDSIITLTVNLVNNYQEVVAEADDICVTERSYTWRNHTISTATSDYDNAHTYYVYDTLASGIIEYITVKQHPIVYATERRTACDSYTWNGTEYTESTSRATAFFPNGSQYGCDSTVTLILTINHNTNATLTAVACESYTWTAVDGGDGRTYTESGTYTYDYNTLAGCPSTNTLELTVNTNSSTAYTADACDSYTWTATDGTDVNTYTASGVYTYDYLTADGCPSADTLNLTIRNNSNTTFTEVACDAYVWTASNGGDDSVYTATGIYTFAYTAGNGCPSTNTLDLTVNQNSSTAYTASACDSYTWNGIDYTVSGDYLFDYNDANNCPSVDTLHLTVNNSSLNVMTVVECNSYTWTASNGAPVGTFTESGAYEFIYHDANGCTVVDSLYLTIGNGRAFGIARVTNCGPYTWVVEGNTVAVFDESVETSITVTNPATGCDSTVFLYLTVNPQTVTTATICDNGSYTWAANGTTYTTAGTYDESATDANGNCVSNERLVLTVNETKATALTDQICLGNGYAANGFSIAAAELATAGEHIFTDSLTTYLGCDSIVTLTLTVGDVISNPVAATACDSYNWNAGDGQTYTYTASGTYNSTAYANALGCTTVDVLTLTVNQNAGTEYTETVCDGYMWNGTQYTESGDYTFDYTDGNGCASTDVLHLTVNNSVINSIDMTACDSYTWSDGDGQTYTTSGVYAYNYTTTDGCSGTDYLVLTVNNSNNSDETVTACDSYDWYGATYTASGTYTYTDTTAAGCVSTHTLALTVNRNSNSAEMATSCGLYVWNGLACSTTGDYTFAYTAANGCPSVDTLHLTVNSPVVVTIDTTVCGAFVWNGVSYQSSDVITHTFAAANGCDSIEVINLTVNAINSSSETATACNEYLWHGTTYTASGNYTYSYATSNGCMGVDTLHLTVVYSTNTAETITACDSYTWNGTTYNQTGVFTYQYNSATSCPSVDTLYLTVNNSTTGSETASACGLYVWNGTAYTTSGNYTQTLTAANGCDSVVTMALTINSAVINSFAATACGSYNWNNVTYTASGNYTQTFTSAAGCDSIVTLNLTLTPAITSTVTMTVCDSYTWNGTTLTTSGAYTHTYTSALGCDSVVTLLLTVNNSTSTETAMTACDSYTWHGTTYTASGTYNVTSTGSNGCTHTETLTLTINASSAATVEATACDSYEWNGVTYTVSTNAPTATLTNVAGCDSVVTLNLTVNYSTNAIEAVATCDSYTWHGNTYGESTVVTANGGTNAAGCDSTVTLHLTINYSADTNIVIEVNSTDVPYYYNGQYLSESGDYQFNLTTEHGCDSTVHLHFVVNQIGIDEVDLLGDITVYPNPTRGQLTISAESVLKVEVLDIVGRTVATFENTNTFDISNLGTGAYTLRISLPEGVTVRKVVKK